MLAVLTLLAQDAPKSGPPAGLDQLMMILAFGIPLLLFMILPMRRERKQRQAMMSSLDKGDRVVINGAIVGTVIQVVKSDHPTDDGELLLKIDENANVKLRVLRSSVTRVIKDKKESKEGA
jgi:preprotein translocase subunit YajC